MKVKKKNKLARWQKEQKQKKKENVQQWLWLGGLFILFIFLLVGAAVLWKKARLSVWDGRSTMSVIYLKKDEAVMESYQPAEQRWLELKIPLNALVKVPFGYGEYQLKNVYDLGELDGKGGELLRRTMQETMGLWVQGWVIKGKNKSTNLSWLDQWRLWLVKKWKVDKKIDYELKFNPAFIKEKLNDGTDVFKIEEKRLDELINQEFFDSQIIDEQLTIAIVNNTEVDGIAGIVGRLASNLGGEVVWLGNGEGNLENSKMIIADEDFKKSTTSYVLGKALRISEIIVGEVIDLGLMW